MSLLSSIDKKPYQAFTIEHGIERIRVQIPLHKTREFEEAFEVAQSAGKNKEALLKIVEAYGGSIRRNAK